MTYGDLPATQDLILETLAARNILGEPFWPFPNRMKPALRALEALGLVSYQPHNAGPGFQRASLTDQGMARMFPADRKYRSPLEREVERLTNSRAEELVTQTGFEGIDIEPGAVTVRTRPPHDLVKAMATALASFLGDAPNYNETPIGIPTTTVSQEVHAAGDIEWYVMTVQRKPGRTPHELRVQAEAERDAERRACDLADEALRHIQSSRDPRAPEYLRQLAEGARRKVAEIRGAS